MAILRILALHRPDFFKHVAVRPVSVGKIYFRNPGGKPKFTSDCGGESITVRVKEGEFAIIGVLCTWWPEVFWRLSYI